MIQINQNHFGKISKLINSSLSAPLRLPPRGCFFLHLIIILSSFQGGLQLQNFTLPKFSQIVNQVTPKGTPRVNQNLTHKKTKEPLGVRRGQPPSPYMYICHYQKIRDTCVNHRGAREYSSKCTREYPRGGAVKSTVVYILDPPGSA